MNSTVQPLLDQLYQRRQRGIKLGLDRVIRLLESLGNPHRRFPAIHIAGTNGKGTVASLLASIYTAAGYRTGLFTSPHLVSFRERIRLNGKPIAESILADLLSHILPRADHHHATFFEITTALAFQFFADQNVDLAIIETGMGGRLDATNVLSPRLTIITSISLDHTRQLGDSRERIAWEKAGIFKPFTPALIADTDLAPIFTAVAKERNAPLTILEESVRWKITAQTMDGHYLHYSSPRHSELSIFVPLLGTHHALNTALALRATELLHSEFPVQVAALRKGIAAIWQQSGYQARLQPLRLSPPLILDTAHNPAGIAATITALQQHFPQYSQWGVAFAALADKPWESMVNQLAEISKFFFLCPLDEGRALNPHRIAQYLCPLRPSTVWPSPRALLPTLTRLSWPLLITGSFYFAGALLQEGLSRLTVTQQDDRNDIAQ